MVKLNRNWAISIVVISMIGFFSLIVAGSINDLFGNPSYLKNSSLFMHPIFRLAISCSGIAISINVYLRKNWARLLLSGILIVVIVISAVFACWKVIEAQQLRNNLDKIYNLAVINKLEGPSQQLVENVNLVKEQSRQIMFICVFFFIVPSITILFVLNRRGNKIEFTRNPLELESRVLCSDGTCIGVIEDDGKCKECGKSFEPDPISVEEDKPLMLFSGMKKMGKWFTSFSAWKRIFLFALSSCYIYLMFHVFTTKKGWDLIFTGLMDFAVIIIFPYIIINIIEYLFSKIKKGYDKTHESIRTTSSDVKTKILLYVGGGVFVIGVLGLFFSLGMDTSVSSTTGEKFNNLGLMNDKQNYLNLSCFTILIGTLIIMFSAIKAQLAKKNAIQSSTLR